MRQLKINKEEALRNNKHPKELGLLRAGYIFCGICWRTMTVTYTTRDKAVPSYRCYRRTGNGTTSHNHRTAIGVHSLDNAVKEKIMEALRQPEVIRAKVGEIRAANKGFKKN